MDSHGLYISYITDILFHYRRRDPYSGQSFLYLVHDTRHLFNRRSLPLFTMQLCHQRTSFLCKYHVEYIT